MPRGTSKAVQIHLRTLFHCGAAGELGDEQLLDRFLGGRGGPAEAAFAALVDRHGPMVLGVCRRVLGDRHEAEDAFQAVFLVLARKAGTVVHRENLDRWLYGVALRTALEARARGTRRRAGESRPGAMTPAEPTDPAEAGELRAVLDEELARLPEGYRSAVLLCELEGLSRREAARRLGVSEGTLSSRLARAKARLKDSLARRGLAPSAAALAALLAREARAAVVPPKLAEATARAATLVAAGTPAAGVVSASVATLTEGVLKTMLIAKLRGAALGLAALTLLAAGMSATWAQSPDQGGRGLESRLESVERKLDLLLESMGGPSGPDRKPSPARERTTADAAPATDFDRRVRETLVDIREPVTTSSSDLHPARAARPSETRPATNGDVLRPAEAPGRSPARDHAEFRDFIELTRGRSDFVERLDALEKRFDRLEAQVGEMGRRLEQLEPKPKPEVRP